MFEEEDALVGEEAKDENLALEGAGEEQTQEEEEVDLDLIKARLAEKEAEPEEPKKEG